MDLTGVVADLRRITVEIRDRHGSFGAGALWPAGHVVTNAHVARSPRLTLALADGRRLDGLVVARDERTDLAVVRIVGSEIEPATPLDAPPPVGSLVIAVGHPFGVRSAVTVGIVHAVGPVVRGGRAWIQADLRLGPGNSGGPIADVGGRIVGLSAMVMNGLGLAIPMAEVRSFVRAAGIVV